MGKILEFTHAAASLEVPAAASASNVMCEQPLASARRANSNHRRGGMPRVRQVLTVDTSTARADATAVVPPRSLIVASEVSITPTIVGKAPTCQALANGKPTYFPKYVPMLRMGDTLKATARRLKQTRLALGFESQKDFAEEIGMDKATYNPFETGARRITLTVAIKIKTRFAVPLDWIYCGDPSGLPSKVFQKINRPAA